MDLVKMALDAGTRANLADREQREYLEGGELPSNAPQQVYADPKLASTSKQHKKVAMLGSGTFTPARSLSQTRSVGNFQDKIIHKGDRLRPPTMGQKFTIPSTPGE